MPQKTTKEDPAFGKYVRYGLQGAILCVLATAVVLFLTVEPETWSHLSEFNWWFAPVIVLTIIVAWLCNGGRIFVISRALGHRLTYAQAVSVSLSTESVASCFFSGGPPLITSTSSAVAAFSFIWVAT